MLNSSEVRVAPFGHVFVAEVGTSPPTDLTTAYAAEWLDLGYVNEDGVSIAPSLDTTDHMMWQSIVPVKTSATGLSLEISFSMGQINTGTTSLFFFGAEWVEESPGIYKLDVGSDILLAEKAMSIEWTDDEGSVNRFTVPRGFVADRENLQLQRSEVTTLGITYKALDDSGDFFHLLSNNPALQPSS